MKKFTRRPGRSGRKSGAVLPPWKQFVLDIVIVGLALLVFALFHHVIPHKADTSNAIVVDRNSLTAGAQVTEATPEPTGAQTVESMAAATPEPTEGPTPEPTPEPTPTPTPEPVGYFGTKYADKFTDGEIIRSGTTYQSGSLNVTMRQDTYEDTTIYVADFYIKDISNLVTALAKDSFGKNLSEKPAEIAARIGSVVAINGDYYSVHDSGVVIRNGVVYRTNVNYDMDICVLYYDGTMETYSPQDFDIEAAIENGAYQAWSFGPRLLEDGEAQTRFNTSVNPENPRTAIGYYEPGHYCFVVADGRNESSVGLTMEQLSRLMASLGCSVAYNLDGGNTAQMVCETTELRTGTTRSCSDIIAIVN